MVASQNPAKERDTYLLIEFEVAVGLNWQSGKCSVCAILRIVRRVSSTLRHLAWEFSDFLSLSFGQLAPAVNPDFRGHRMFGPALIPNIYALLKKTQVSGVRHSLTAFQNTFAG